MTNAIFVHHSDSTRYQFGDQHPFSPVRQTLTMDLLYAAGALQEEQTTSPSELADEALLSLVHRTDYIQAVQQLSLDNPAQETASAAGKYGLDTEDTPYFPGMHDAAATITAGSVYAAKLVMSGAATHAYHMAGGLHHAFPDRGAGFCVYNDAAVAIQYIRKTYGARVLYIDTDVHHGDGVQWSFYNDPDVCTYSIHETGKFLFPGTGFVHEKGTDAGFGSCFNVPMEPYTEDDSWLECFRSSIAKIAAAFKPDIIVSQHGCDAHAYDPLSHIHCSMRIYHEMPGIIHDLAHEHTEGRWMALGGGGYDWWRVVPRAWSLVWLTMTDHPIIEQLNRREEVPLPTAWLEKWSSASPEPLPSCWLDDLSQVLPIPRRAEIELKNRQTAAIAIQDL
ncbi:acetoin utilization protein AcuC [Paenibacillus glycanilyticus]|uniref:Acetoin utilization protein AcuC n=1 Tax=Paenibacillus glycanilyticus TaxID=126569 RepID=A0ABQ6GDL3_9BACL|nr:acetoin utilization protein AcuC [Paenibacillus glycanilyticus]GLX68360.1 acetoin utilization protein AcuC [Paenibacillus glycanilyticus]